MTREELSACTKIGAAAATLVTLVGGPVLAAFLILDKGVRNAATQCETRALSEASFANYALGQAYAEYVNARVTVIMIEQSIEPSQGGRIPFSLDVARHRVRDKWKEVERLKPPAKAEAEEEKNCPRYRGLLE